MKFVIFVQLHFSFINIWRKRQEGYDADDSVAKNTPVGTTRAKFLNMAPSEVRVRSLCYGVSTVNVVMMP